MTKRQLEILKIMRDTGEELVYEGGQGFLGLSHIAPRTVFALLRVMALRASSDSHVGEVERYTIGETGLDILRENGL